MTMLIGIAAAGATFAGIRKLEKMFGGKGDAPVAVEHFDVPATSVIFG